MTFNFDLEPTFVTFRSQSGERSNFETNRIDGIVEYFECSPSDYIKNRTIISEQTPNKK